MHNQFRDSGYKVFGLYGADVNGHCLCSRDDCEAPYKHPIARNWQHTPLWSDEQWETAHDMDQFATGYGVLCSGLLVVDVDARNGGVASYDKLASIVGCAGLIVATGSGGGSKHLYFTLPDGLALSSHLKEYPGIDFKSSGFVVGPGSMHISGDHYECVAGSVEDIGTAPQELIDMLLVPYKHRGEINGSIVDVSLDEIADMLSHIPNDVEYDTYVKIGMAIHHTTKGAGFDVWDNWSSKSDKYTGGSIGYRWQSFGKSANPVTLGTLAYHAEQGGWVQDVTFVSTVSFSDDLDLTGIDLLRPPGFVGRLVDWINSQSIFPREVLAVAAGLNVVSCVAGMRYIDSLDNVTPNLFCFGVAGSGTGKESILKSSMALLKSAGVSAAIYGDIKSEQEIYRNLTRHQGAFYLIDELGEKLSKINNAMKRGGASYLEGVIGTLMSIYSKADSFALVTGDLKEEIRKQLQAEILRLQRRIDENEDVDGMAALRIKRVTEVLSKLDLGIEAPYLSLMGVTTPEKFESLMDYEMAVNGFMGRSLIFREMNDNPHRKPRGIVRGVPDSIAATLQMMYSPGVSDIPDRVERIGERVSIETRPDAVILLDRVQETYWTLADEHASSTGLQAIPRRGYEHVAKISTVLAIPEGVRTVEHVLWAYALVKRDIEVKTRLAHSNTAEAPSDALASKILGLISADHGETVGRIRRKCRGVSLDKIQAVLDALVDADQLTLVIEKTGGRPSNKYYSI